MTSMYQSVDDPEDVDIQARKDRAARRRAFWVWLALGLLIVAAAAFFKYARPSAPIENNIASKAEHASYRTALSEPNMDLRRARLHDFEITYAESQLLPAVRAQLAVLNTHETRAWAVLTDVMFNPYAKRIDKHAAIDAYETKWGASYLGGREADIKALREKLELDIEALPDRVLTDIKSPIPKNVPDRVMVGGPRAAPPPRPAPAAPTPTPAPPKTAQIIPAQVRKNVTPRYPRSAQRRGINAVVELSLSIAADGEVEMSEVVRADASRYKKKFIKASERAAMKTKYTPRRVNGKAVPATGVIKRYVFRVQE